MPFDEVGKPRSLTARLLLVAALFSLILLVAGGFGASRLYQATVYRDVNDRLDGDLRALVTAADAGIGGRELKVTGPPDPRYEQTFSGRYWAVWRVRNAELMGLARSASFYDEGFELGPEKASVILAETGGVLTLNAEGPTGEPLHLRARAISLGERAETLVFAVALDERPIRQDVREFTVAILSVVGLLAVLLMTTIFLQVRWGLAPLGRLRSEIDDIRAGGRSVVDGPVPREVAPLVSALNELIRTNQRDVEVAREQAGNLAHALKTPLSIMRNAAATETEPERRHLFTQQVEAMQASIERHLRLARAQASARHGDASTSLADAAERLVRVVGRMHPDRGVDIRSAIPAGNIRVERHDLDDILGNLLDNAMKWTRSVVELRAERDGYDWTIIIDDDGPGLPADLRLSALQRGKRLDETAAGSGLGLAIVDELVKAYNGEVQLLDSPLGGLRVELRLPSKPDATS